MWPAEAGFTMTLSQRPHGRPCGRPPARPSYDGHAGAVPDLPSPDAGRRLLLREEVGRLRRRESRRVFDTSVHVGVLGGPRTGFVARAADLPALDAALRTDVVSALVEQADDDWRTAWLVRAGTPHPHDLDLQWLASVHAAFAIHLRALDGCYVVTRGGWRDAHGGEMRTWARLRL